MKWLKKLFGGTKKLPVPIEKRYAPILCAPGLCKVCDEDRIGK